MTVVSTTYDFPQSADKVFEFFAEHENLAIIFAPLRIKRIADGTDGTRNGPGSTRKMVIAGPLHLVEQTTEVVPNEKIVYKLIGGVPVKYHRGEMVFTANPDGGTKLTYEIDLVPPIPFSGPIVARALMASIVKALPKAEKAIG